MSAVVSLGYSIEVELLSLMASAPQQFALDLEFPGPITRRTNLGKRFFLNWFLSGCQRVAPSVDLPTSGMLTHSLPSMFTHIRNLDGKFNNGPAMSCFSTVNHINSCNSRYWITAIYVIVDSLAYKCASNSLLYFHSKLDSIDSW